MVLILSEADIAGLLTMEDGVRLMEQAFRWYADGRVILPPRIHQDLPAPAGALRVVSAALPDARSFGLKTLTGTPGQRLPSEIYFVVLLFDTASGALRAILPANYLTGLRTGAVTGVAVKHLARKNARIHGVLGAGAQAIHQIRAVASVRSIEEVRIFAPHLEKASALALEVSAEFGIESHAVGEAEEAVRGCDIVTAITTAREPVVKGAWLEPGAHVTSAGANARGKRELDGECFRRSKVITDSQTLASQEAGDLRAALQNGDIAPQHLHAELGEVIHGAKAGRTAAEEITLFKSMGIGFQDIALADFLYHRAMEAEVDARADLERAGLGL